MERNNQILKPKLKGRSFDQLSDSTEVESRMKKSHRISKEDKMRKNP